MSQDTQDNKALVRRYVEQCQGAGKEDTADDLPAADDLHHSGPAWARADTIGRDGAKGFIFMLRAAFPDLYAVIHEQLGEGDTVMTCKSFSGTDRGDFWGVPRPAGR